MSYLCAIFYKHLSFTSIYYIDNLFFLHRTFTFQIFTFIFKYFLYFQYIFTKHIMQKLVDKYFSI